MGALFFWSRGNMNNFIRFGLATTAAILVAHKFKDWALAGLAFFAILAGLNMFGKRREVIR